jgi:putative pyruvate formate lyase activating enzyme
MIWCREWNASKLCLPRVRSCPKDCGNDRSRDEIAACYSGRLPIVSSYTAHFGEEPCLSGTHGAGNIFFGNCNLRCVYCQNHQDLADVEGTKAKRSHA